VKWRTLNAADYGVPQTRKRVITVAIREDQPVPSQWYPSPTHAETATTTLAGESLEEWVTVQDAIGDLPGLEHTPAGVEGQGSWRDGDEPAHSVTGAGNHVVRATNHVAQEHTEQAKERFRGILSGEIEGKGLSGRVADLDDPSPTITADEGAAVPPIKPPNHEPPHSDEACAKEADQEPSEPGKTVVAARNESRYVNSDGGPRRLTVRECARLQSFPDWFVFTGTKTDQYAQVGNAVPPLLQYHVASHLRDLLEETEATSTQGAVADD